MAIKKRSKKIKKAVKRPAAKKAKKKPAKRAVLKPVGKVTHFYGGIKVAIVKFSKPVRQGTEVTFKGATTEFSQKLDSMQYDHEAVKVAAKGKQTGVKVKKRVREGDLVYPA